MDQILKNVPSTDKVYDSVDTDKEASEAEYRESVSTDNQQDKTLEATFLPTKLLHRVL